jgi:uncharacterized membrane protein
VGKTRLEAFSDGVIAILITIMVLELRLPESGTHDAFADSPEAATLHALAGLWPIFLAYVLSFVFLGIYWNNHHHMLHMTRRINGKILWANLHLLFWLSLVPFVTAWLGAHHDRPTPTALYGGVLFMAAVAYTILLYAIVAADGPDSTLAAAIGGDAKGKVSLALYAAAVALAFVRPWISQVIYVIVALIWIVPDKRIESRLAA